MLVGVIMCAAAAGCGALSHQELLFQMNKRCYQANVELSKLGSKFDAFKSGHQHQRVVDVHDKFVEEHAQFVRGLETLEPPAEDRDAFELYFRGAKQQAILAKREARFARRAEHPEKPITRYDDAYERAYKARDKGARDLGADECGQG